MQSNLVVRNHSVMYIDTGEKQYQNIENVNCFLASAPGSSFLLFATSARKLTHDEITEMVEVCSLCERHGFVVGRIDGLELQPYIQRYSVLPFIDGIPLLVKSDLFKRFGLLDVQMPDLYSALVEYSLRVNQYGFNTVRANYVSIKEGYPINQDMLPDCMYKRYPYIDKIAKIYASTRISAVEHFATILSDKKIEKPKLLFSLYEVPASYNGTANYSLQSLRAFYGLYKSIYEISILAKRDTDIFHHLSEQYPNVYTPDNIQGHFFEFGYSFSQILDGEHIQLLNQTCLRFGVCMLDIICLRSNYLYKNAPDRFMLFRDTIRFSDLILSISRFSLDDIKSYFKVELDYNNTKTGFIYLGNNKKREEIVWNEHIPYDQGDYILIIGNPYKHKMLEPVIEKINDIAGNYIVIGTKLEGYVNKSKTIYGYVSGWLDDNFLDTLLAGSKAILFPSVYEGFGLTFYDAILFRKKIIVCDTEINRELYSWLADFQQNIILYNNIDELKIVLQSELCQYQENGQNLHIRTWDEVAVELERYIQEIVNSPVLIEKLEKRWEYLSHIYPFIVKDNKYRRRERRIHIQHKCIYKFPKLYRIYRRIVTTINKEHYGNH